MAALLFLLSFAGLGLALERLLGSKQHIGTLLAMSLIILVHFLAGCAGWPLYTASYAVMGLSLAASVWMLFPLSNLSSRINWLPAGFIVLAGLIFYFMLEHAYLRSWDEFSHWGVIAKELFLMDQFPANPEETSILFIKYPPGTALFYYYVMRFTGFGEGYIFFAQAMLFVSFSLVLMPRENIRISRAWVPLALTWLSFYLNSDSYHTIYVDGILGAFFGAILAVYLSERLQPFKALLLLVPLLAAITLVKTSAMPFIFLAAVFILIDIFTYHKTYSLKKKIALLLLLFLGIACAFGSKYAWQESTKTLIDQAGLRAYSISNLIADFDNTEMAEKYEKTVRNFLVKVPRVFLSHGGIALLFIALLPMIAAYRLDRQNFVHIGKMQLILFSGFLLYAAGLLLLYLTSFSPQESVELASHERYIRTYFIGWSMVGVFLLQRLSHDLDLKENRNGDTLSAERLRR
jgi:hypothetical protein